MKLLTLKLKNFKGLKSFTLDTCGGDVSILGDNATGKTSIMDAFLWLLFGKDSQNRADFEIKTLGEDGNAIHGLDHEVEAHLIAGGKTITLRKVFMEKWTKKRGSATKEFTGHTTDHFIEGVPVQKKEYDAKVAEIADEQVFKLLTDPRFFNEFLHWQKRREILLEVCGDVSDADVIAADKALSKLPEILGDRTIEDHRKIIAVRRTEINKELQKIPVRIDEVETGLPDISDIDLGRVDDDIEKMQEKIREKQQELARIEAGGEAAKKQKQLAQIEAEILEVENKQTKEHRTRMLKAQGDVDEVGLQISKLDREIDFSKADTELMAKQSQDMEAEVEALRENWHQVDAQAFEYQDESICPTCGQNLPTGMVEEARNKANSQFNSQKSKELERIAKEGKRLQEARESLLLKQKKISGEIDEKIKQIIKLEQQKARHESKLTTLSNVGIAAINDPAYTKKQQERDQLITIIEKYKKDNTEITNNLKNGINICQNALSKLEESRSKLRLHEQGEKRIAELSSQERVLAAEYEQLEEELYLTEQFVRIKVELLEEKINSKFKMARFKLFNVLVNGGIEECCETIFLGVPYSSLNNGARINIGLDIINTLSEHYGLEVPIFIDNKEAVTRLIPTKAQLIGLVVSEKDKKLRIEAEKENIKEAV